MNYDEKLSKAKSLASSAVHRLRDDDMICLIAFDHLVEIVQPFSLRTTIQDPLGVMAGIQARGTTNIALAFKDASNAIGDEGGEILLLSDGRANTALSGAGSEGDELVENEMMNLATELSTRGIAISAVAIGEDAFTSFLERQAEDSGGKFWIEVDGVPKGDISLDELEVTIQGVPEELPSGKPTWAKELNVKHTTVASSQLCDKFAKGRTAFLKNPRTGKKARVSLLSIEDPVLEPFRKRAPKTTRRVRESTVVLADATYRRALGVAIGQSIQLCLPRSSTEFSPP